MRGKNEDNVLVSPYMTQQRMRTRSSRDHDSALINPHNLMGQPRGGSPFTQSCGSPLWQQEYNRNDGDSESKESCCEKSAFSAPSSLPHPHSDEDKQKCKEFEEFAANYEPAEDADLSSFLLDTFNQSNEMENNVVRSEGPPLSMPVTSTQLARVSTFDRDILNDLLSDFADEGASPSFANHLVTGTSLNFESSSDSDVDSWIQALHLGDSNGGVPAEKMEIPAPQRAVAIPAPVTVPVASGSSRKRRHADTVKAVPAVAHQVLSHSSLDVVPALINHGFHSFQSAVIGQENKKLESFQERQLFITNSNKTGILYFIIEKTEGDFPCSLEMWGAHAAAHFKPIYTNDNSPLAMLFRVIPLHDHENSLTYSQNLLGKNEEHLWGEIDSLGEEGATKDNHNFDTEDPSSFHPLAAGSVTLPLKRGRYLVAIQPVKGLLNSKSIESRGYQHTALRFLSSNGEETIYKGQVYKCASKDPHFVKVKKEKSS
jgi:hypothetical protein